MCARKVSQREGVSQREQVRGSVYRIVEKKQREQVLKGMKLYEDDIHLNTSKRLYR